MDRALDSPFSEIEFRPSVSDSSRCISVEDEGQEQGHSASRSQQLAPMLGLHSADPKASPPAGVKGQILLIGDDETLQSTRAAILQRDGYSAIVRGTNAYEEPVLWQTVDLVIVCHFVARSTFEAIRQGTHEHSPALHVLYLSTPADGHADASELLVTGALTPRSLLGEIGRLISSGPSVTSQQ
jgi:hypothetical protein